MAVPGLPVLNTRCCLLSCSAMPSKRTAAVMQTVQQQQMPALLLREPWLRPVISINILLRRRRAATAQT